MSEIVKAAKKIAAIFLGIQRASQGVSASFLCLSQEKKWYYYLAGKIMKKDGFFISYDIPVKNKKSVLSSTDAQIYFTLIKGKHKKAIPLLLSASPMLLGKPKKSNFVESLIDYLETKL